MITEDRHPVAEGVRNLLSNHRIDAKFDPLKDHHSFPFEPAQFHAPALLAGFPWLAAASVSLSRTYRGIAQELAAFWCRNLCSAKFWSRNMIVEEWEPTAKSAMQGVSHVPWLQR